MLRRRRNEVHDPHEPLARPLTDLSTRSRQFRRDRRCNCALCLASLQANEVTFASSPLPYSTRRSTARESDTRGVALAYTYLQHWL